MTQQKINKPNWIQYFILVILVIGTIGIFTYDGEKIVNNGISQSDFNNAINKINSDKNIEIQSLNEKINELKNTSLDGKSNGSVLENGEDSTLTTYLIDKLSIGDSINEELTNREITLFDGDVTFDNDKFGAEEVIFINGMNLTTNKEDFNADVYSVVTEGNFEYMFKIDPDLNTSLIGVDDEYLTLNLLGKNVEISNWDGGGLTFRYGSEFLLSEDQVFKYKNNSMVLSFINENSVYVKVGDESKKIKEGDTATIGNLEIYVSEILYTSKDSRVSKAVLRIGSEIETTISNGDEYAEDSIWEWKITSNSIGLILIEEYKYLDEDYKPLAIGESICLPNDYVCIKFGGISKEDYRDYDFRYKESRNETKITGDFVIGYDSVGTIIANSDGTFYNDDDDENVTDTIELENSDLVLKFNGDNTTLLLVDKENNTQLEILFNVSGVSADNDNVNQEEDYRSNYGVIIANTEDIEDDQELSISVPEEKVEGFFLVY